MSKEEFLNQHEEYGDIDLTNEEENKLRGMPFPGATVNIHWKTEGGIVDVGYLFLLPFQDECIDDYFVHCPSPVNTFGKGDAEPEWAHINKLLKNPLIEKVIIISNQN